VCPDSHHPLTGPVNTVFPFLEKQVYTSPWPALLTGAMAQQTLTPYPGLQRADAGIEPLGVPPPPRSSGLPCQPVELLPDAQTLHRHVYDAPVLLDPRDQVLTIVGTGENYHAVATVETSAQAPPDRVGPLPALSTRLGVEGLLVWLNHLLWRNETVLGGKDEPTVAGLLYVVRVAEAC